jgi:hypothetical protein
MATSRLSDKLKAAITAAAAQLSQRQERLAKSAPAPGAAGSPTLTPTAALTPTPGDLYVFDTGQDVAIEWLVVRAHPDDPDLILLAPVDDFPLAGTPDLVLPVERVGRPMTVRCGETDWFPRSLFTPDLRVDSIPDDLLALVRRRLADLARGRALEPQAPTIDLDPEYEDWLAEVAQARSTLLARAELSQLTLRQPTPAPADRLPELALAAESGGSFRRMFSPSVVTEMFAVADEPLWRTNPRWCIRRLQPQQPALAERLAQALPPANPGVVGLVVDTISREALVVPLRAERSSDWYVDPTLPFHQAGTLAELLGRLVRSLGLPHLDGIPERFAYTLHDPLGRRSDGPSMHLAGLLAVIRQVNSNPPLLDRACCVAQPDGERLVSVGGLSQKLDAFRREYGTGTLLVRCRDAKAAEFDAYFDTVWEVDSLAELARQLEQAELLQVFLDGQPLSAVDAKTILNRVRQLEEIEHRYAEALDLCQRVERAGFSPAVPSRLQRKFRQRVIDFYRHLGAYRKAAELAQAEHQRSRSSAIQSYEEQARADLTYAAAQYASHRFAAIHQLLNPWRERLTADPLLLTPLTRVKVFNTLGRAWVAWEREGWEDLFQRSAEILHELEPTDLPRTWSYLTLGYLHAGQLREAEAVIARIEAHPGLGEMSRWFLRTHQADLARRQGRIWSDPEMDRATVSTRVGHPFAFYFQATARQPGRPLEDALERFRRARAFLTQDLPDGDPHNIQRFLADCLLLAEAAWMADPTRWQEAISAIQSYLDAPAEDGLADHYAGSLPAKDSPPSREAAERLLDRVPFF